MSSDAFLGACKDGTLSRTDAINFTNEQDPPTRTKGLETALERGHFNAARYLLEVEPAINITASTARCAAYGGLLVYRLLHSMYPEIIHWGDRVGNAVHSAVRCHNLEVLTYILENGGDPGRTVECQRHMYIYTALDCCALSDNEEAARLLVRHGAAFDFTQVLSIAVHSNRPNLVNLMIELGANVNSLRPEWDLYWNPGQNHRALYEAVQKGQLGMVQLLLAHGADPRLKELNGMTAMKAARKAGNSDVLGLLNQPGKGSPWK